MSAANSGFRVFRSVRWRPVICFIFLFAGHTYSAPLLSVDFESDTVGSQPTTSGAIVRPATSTATNYVTVVDSSGNKAGTGQGVRFNDNGLGVGTALEYNFVSSAASQISLVQASFYFSCITSNSGTASYISVGLGAYSNSYSMNNATPRWNELRLYQNNTMKITTNGSSTGSYFLLNAGASNTLTMFVNDSTASIDYNFNGAQTLAADSVAYWLNGTKVSTVLLDNEVTNSVNNFGKISFSSSTSATNMDYAFDNIAVWDISTAPSVSATAATPTGSGTGTGGLTVGEGSSITLTEIPSAGTPPFTYAWKKVGSGAVLGTNSNLPVSSPTNGAQYTCDVAATWDGVTNTSPAATLTVLPLVSATAAKPTGNGSGTGGLTAYAQRTCMTLTETPSGGTPPFTYAWKKIGAGTVLGTTDTLTISPLVNGDQYVCDVASISDGVTNTSPTATLTVTSVIDSNKVIFIKADDFRGPVQAWTNFLVSSRNLGVKVGIGIICTNTIDPAYAAAQPADYQSITNWLQTQQAAGDVEFWNHAWSHTSWTDTNGVTIYEYQSSGLAFQQTNMARSQAAISNALGRDAVAFGPPYNQIDTNTATIINATPALRLFFASSVTTARSYGLSDNVAAVKIIGEADGTGMANAATFQATQFPPGSKGPVALQFHPPVVAFTTNNSIVQYEQIVQYLLTNGYAILLPSEYVAAFAPNVAPSVSLTAPTNNAGFTVPASITMTATASDTDGIVTNVDFYNGATLLGSDAGSPYAYTGTNVAAGSYSLTARATDNDGAVSTSAVVTVTVVSPVYTLTVNSGTGGGSCTNGQQVAISAYAPAAGKAFSQWTGDTQYVNNVTYTNAIVTISTNAVTLTATYVDVYYALVINYGTDIGATLATNGMVMPICADDPTPGMIFFQWVGDTACLANSNVACTTLTMPAKAVSLTATYKSTEQYTTNGTPYSWLAGYGLTNYEADAVLDQDSDGLKTWQEYIAGTDPTNAASCFKAVQMAPNKVSWSAVSGRVYSVYWSTNLVQGFQPLNTNIVYPQSGYTNATPDSRLNHYQIKVRLQ